MRPFAILLCLAIASNGSPAFAGGVQSAAPTDLPTSRIVERRVVSETAELLLLGQVPGDEASQVGDVEARIAALESRRAAISTRGPRAAVITGGVLTGVGAGVAALTGIVCAAAAAGTSTQCKVDNAIGLAVGGAVVAIAGVITLLSGRAKLRKRNQEREVIEQEIQTLERQRASKRLPSVGVALGRGNAPALVLGFRF